jgi:hypothetical protein
MKSYRYKQVVFGKPKSLSLCAIGKRRMAMNKVSESPEESVKSEMI